MARETRSAEEIWFEINTLVLACLEGFPDPTVYLPLPAPSAAPDASGCNWCIGGFDPGHPVAAQVEAAVRTAKRNFNLPDGGHARRWQPGYDRVAPMVFGTRVQQPPPWRSAPDH